MAVTGLREEKGWRRVGEEEEGRGGSSRNGGGFSLEKRKNTHQKGKIETPSCYSSLTFSMSTRFARTLWEIALDECDFSDNISAVRNTAFLMDRNWFVLSSSPSQGNFAWLYCANVLWQRWTLQKYTCSTPKSLELCFRKGWGWWWVQTRQQKLQPNLMWYRFSLERLHPMSRSPSVARVCRSESATRVLAARVPLISDSFPASFQNDYGSDLSPVYSSSRAHSFNAKS